MIDEVGWVSYPQARAAFLQAATGLQRLSFPNPRGGPDGEALAVDVVILGNPEARNLLLVVSGTHGIEGLSGSRIQTRLLQERRLRPAQGSDLAVVLIHALNPFGFAWSRRVTEEGVDLARNFVDFDQPFPENAAFAELADHLLPRDFDGPAKKTADEALNRWIASNGVKQFRAIARGQYSHPAAPFFGGTGPTWSNHTWRTVLRRFAATCRQLVVLDLHTGLGTRGEGVLIGMHDGASAAARWGKTIWGTRFSAMGAGEVGYAVTGSLADAVQQELPEARSLVATYEFGIGPELEAVESLRADHWLFAFGDPLDAHSVQTAAIRKRMRRAFFDPSNGWADAVQLQMIQAGEQALAALGAPPG